MRRALVAALIIALAGVGGLALARTAGTERSDFVAAQREAAEATKRSEILEGEAKRATSEASRARAEAGALAARIESAEADITAAETRIRLIEALRAQQRARLAEMQGPVIRLTAALQTMARRPPALALIQPGSIDEVVRVRSLLASTLPVIRQRTAGLRAEVAWGNRLRQDADRAVAALTSSREELRKRRTALAAFEQKQRSRAGSLMESAMAESDRALAFGEEARELDILAGTRQFQDQLRSSLSDLPGPVLRPGEGTAAGPRQARAATYRLPVEGRLITGMGEISDGGVHARGLTFATEAGAQIVAPARGRIAYAGRFRGYGLIVIIDHGGGWTTAITNLGALDVKVGDKVAMGAAIGRAGDGEPEVMVELRRNGRPFPIAPLIALG
ncbi:MAG TPA: peptidoglycan DD-metalloendopeptidase family protein [Allosphingosinicella sp.]|nr:peptidoglycan DD-metalloendopeptidase family protein [Allosphingosinicella sp.]